MKLFGLMWSNLFRKRTRTILTMLSVAIAFLLFMLLRSVAGAFETGGNLIGADRLIASPKYSIVDSLPMSQKQQILAVDGVAAVAVGRSGKVGVGSLPTPVMGRMRSRKRRLRDEGRVNHL